mmetsp:Transcript_22491/g.63876  ORF Transcript_22491/g.63876 Transcript_22491/m.63876 type:complete len:234 (-) Transcript_22491:27-728(-)
MANTNPIVKLTAYWTTSFKITDMIDSSLLPGKAIINASIMVHLEATSLPDCQADQNALRTSFTPNTDQMPTSLRASVMMESRFVCTRAASCWANSYLSFIRWHMLSQLQNHPWEFRYRSSACFMPAIALRISPVSTASACCNVMRYASFCVSFTAKPFANAATNKPTPHKETVTGRFFTAQDAERTTILLTFMSSNFSTAALFPAIALPMLRETRAGTANGATKAQPDKSRAT